MVHRAKINDKQDISVEQIIYGIFAPHQTPLIFSDFLFYYLYFNNDTTLQY